MKNLHFDKWLSPELVYPEEDEKDSATLKAVRHAYQLLGKANRCEHCRRKEHLEAPESDLYYLV
jgi:sulfate permease, SulP family